MNPLDFCYKHILEMLAALTGFLILTLRSLGIRRDLNKINDQLEKIRDEIRKIK